MKLFLALVPLITGVALAAPPFVEPKAPPSLRPPLSVVTWVRANAVPMGAPGDLASPQETRAIADVVRGARVIGFGESGHGNAEPLQYRNRLIRHLVLHEGLTAVALESGLAESKNLYDYVLGAPGDPAVLVRSGLTHGFGFIPANAELVAWLRDYNRAHRSRPVRLYGIDASTIQSAAPGSRGYGMILQWLDGYLARTVPAQSGAIRDGLRPFANRFNETDYRNWSVEDQRKAQLLLEQLRDLFRQERRTMIAASSADEYDWAQRIAADAAHLPTVFAAWVDDPTQLDRLLHLIELRDQTMADHTRWVLQREGRHGKVLLFQTNGHTTADILVGSVMRSFPRQPKVTGTLLREALGTRYRTIATVSSRGRSADDSTLGSVDRAFAAAGRSPVFLNLRSPRRPAWWDQKQSASQGDQRVDDLVPSKAFDGVIYLARLTPLPPPPSPKPKP